MLPAAGKLSRCDAVCVFSWCDGKWCVTDDEQEPLRREEAFDGVILSTRSRQLLSAQPYLSHY